MKPTRRFGPDDGRISFSGPVGAVILFFRFFRFFRYTFLPYLPPPERYAGYSIRALGRRALTRAVIIIGY